MFTAERVGEKRGDLILLGLMVLLLGLGLACMLSASYFRSNLSFGDPLQLFKSQAIITVFSLIPAFILSRISLEKLRTLIPILLLFSAVLMLCTFLPGIGLPIQGARRWIQIFGYTFQPSELGKLVIVLYLAHIFSKKADRIGDFFNTVLPPLIVVMGLVFLVYLQNDFSTAFFILFLALAVFFIAGIPLHYFFLLGAVAVPMLIVMLLTKEHRVKRIIAFINPDIDPVGSGYQVRMAKEALAGGGFWGNGFGQSVHKMGGLPEPHSDFIFAVVAEEVGFLGVLVILGLFVLFSLRGYNIALENTDPFRRYLAFGATTAILYQALFNIAVVSGLVPATGIPLPFFSQGGSSILVTLCLCGLLFNCSRPKKGSAL